MRAAGLDGCRAGWFCVSLDPGGAWDIAVLGDAERAGAIACENDVVLIDIPIGLLSEGVTERACDTDARALLRPFRGSSVFPAPARSVLAASSYAEASELNRRITGRGLSRQSWGIVRKIAEIDALLQRDPLRHGRIRECHPEVCFWALNGRVAMRHNKKKLAGRMERVEVIRKYFADVDALLNRASREFRRKDVALDDVLDAVVLAVTAKLGQGKYRTIPEVPARDATGLPMEIVYWVPE